MTSNSDGHTSKLRAWRTSKGLSLDDVSALTGLSKGMLSHSERGERELAALTKVRMARRLGVPVRSLFDVPADQEMAPEVAAYVEEIVAAWPPLTEDQRARLQTLLTPSQEQSGGGDRAA